MGKVNGHGNGTGGDGPEHEGTSKSASSAKNISQPPLDANSGANHAHTNNNGINSSTNNGHQLRRVGSSNKLRPNKISQEIPKEPLASSQSSSMQPPYSNKTSSSSSSYHQYFQPHQPPASTSSSTTISSERTMTTTASSSSSLSLPGIANDLHNLKISVSPNNSTTSIQGTLRSASPRSLSPAMLQNTPSSTDVSYFNLKSSGRSGHSSPLSSGIMSASGHSQVPQQQYDSSEGTSARIHGSLQRFGSMDSSSSSKVGNNTSNNNSGGPLSAGATTNTASSSHTDNTHPRPHNGGTYSPVRTPSITSVPTLTRSSRSKSSVSSGGSSVTSDDRRRSDQHVQAQYLAQQKAYIHVIQTENRDDYHSKGVEQYGSNPADDAIDVDSDDDDAPDVQGEVIGFGGVGTSFDDEYAEMGSHYPLLETGYSREDIDGKPELKERLEWQSMLSSVLTGEVFRSEKKRLGAAPDKASHNGYDDLWIGLRAHAHRRSVDEEKQVLAYARSSVDQVLENISKFNYNGRGKDVDHTVRIVSDALDQFFRCASLYPTVGALLENHKLLQLPDNRRKLDAIIAWEGVTTSVHAELDLLRAWCGNSDLNPTKPQNSDNSSNDKMEERGSLVENILKQDDLSSIFDNRISQKIGPLIAKAKKCTIDYSDVFVEIGLPLFNEGLSKLMLFPIKLIQEIIRMRLSYARKLQNPTMMIIDQMITDFEDYIKLALSGMKKNTEYRSPVLEKGWSFPNQIDEDFDSTLLDCVGFYLELFHKKILENGSTGNAKGPPRMFRVFKDGEQLEQQYDFLNEVSRFIDGGDVLVAEGFATLNTKMIAKLLAYWESQIDGPKIKTSAELEKWYSASMGTVRSFQRRLLRFYRILSDAYENAAEFAIQQSKIKIFMNRLRNTGHFLVLTGSFEQYGIYAIADPYLVNKPEKIRSLIMGYCRHDDATEDDPHIPYVLMFCIQDPLVWEGEIFNLKIPYFDINIKPGRLRLISGGGKQQLRYVRNLLTQLSIGEEVFDIVVETKSHLNKVDHELNKIRRLLFRLSLSVINGVQTIRYKCKPYGCQETVNNLFSFAREFGQRGITVMDANRRGTVAIKLINLCIEWVSFVCDDCNPADYKTFRWTVIALEFAMIMTRGVNIVAISPEQFSKLRMKVAESMTLLISHFDIMGARSKAAERNRDKDKLALRGTMPKDYNNIMESDNVIVEATRAEVMKKLNILEEQRAGMHAVGRVLDDTNADAEFLTFLASSLSNVSIRWQQGRYIGGGTFGAVYAAVNLDTGGVMAVKEIRLQDSQSIRHIIKSIKDEMMVLEILNHPNVVQYYGVEVHRDRVFIFMEYCEGGSLAGLLEYGRIEDEQVIQVYALQMLEGLAYLHQSGIVHRDIKPENILLDHMGVVKFVDFGAAKVIARTGKTRKGAGGAAGNNASNNNNNATPGIKTKTSSMTGTPMYMSPEAITGSDPGRYGSIDIWSLGCCVLEMATGKRPWSNLDNEWAIMYRVAAGYTPNMPHNDQLSEEGQRFITRCLEPDPQKRPSAVELLNDPWIINIRNIVLGSVSTSDDPNDTSASVSAASSPALSPPQLKTPTSSTTPTSVTPLEGPRDSMRVEKIDEKQHQHQPLLQPQNPAQDKSQSGPQSEPQPQPQHHEQSQEQQQPAAVEPTKGSISTESISAK